MIYDYHTRKYADKKSVPLRLRIGANEYERLTYLSQSTDIGVSLLIKQLLYNQLVKTSELNVDEIVSQHKSLSLPIRIGGNEYQKLTYLSQCADVDMSLLIKQLIYDQLFETSALNLEKIVCQYQEYRMDR